MIANLLHAVAHRLDRSAAPCVCRTKAYVDGWRARRDAELAGLSLPSSPDELDASFRRLLAESEA